MIVIPPLPPAQRKAIFCPKCDTPTVHILVDGEYVCTKLHYKPTEGD